MEHSAWPNAPPARIHGVDGCRGGWLHATAWLDAAGRLEPVECTRRATFGDCLGASIDEVLAVDMPIGLLDQPRRGGRDCDITARRLLGWPRRTSVFSPPIRPALAAISYRAAIARNGAGMTVEAYNLLAKIRAVDAALALGPRCYVVEAHPELAFTRLAGAAIAAGKRTGTGLARRRELVEARFGHALDLAGERRRLGRNAVAADDILDAWAVTLTAARAVLGDAERIGSNARDAQGFEMAIYY